MEVEQGSPCTEQVNINFQGKTNNNPIGHRHPHCLQSKKWPWLETFLLNRTKTLDGLLRNWEFIPRHYIAGESKVRFRFILTKYAFLPVGVIALKHFFYGAFYFFPECIPKLF